jgi:predicted enzyme related to lactoylglutathione lyase
MEAEMSSDDASGDTSAASAPVKSGEWKLEVVVIPVSDVDRAKQFYESLVWRLDADLAIDESYRVVQLTPPGSACSIGIGTGLPVYEATPGAVRGLHLVVADIEKARAELAGRGVDIGEVTDVGGGVKYAGFADPDGNTLTLQEMPWRTGESF